MLRLIWATVAVVLLAAPAAAQTVERAPSPDWVVPVDPSAVQPEVGVAGAPMRVLLMDYQIRLEETGTRIFTHNRVQILSAQGLAGMSTLALPWNPSSQTLIAHEVNILRGDEVIDVLAGQDFEVLRREERLESSMMTGVLTATLQPADLRVGDIVELKTSVVTRDPVLPDHGELLVGAQFPFPVERYRLRVSWPTDRAVQIRARAPWTQPRVRRVGGLSIIEIEETDMQPLVVPGDAPSRFHQLRQFEATDYRSWEQLSQVMHPLYARAATLEEGSPLQAEIDRIAGTWSTPGERALEALRLVQDDVRYVARAMGEGGLVPVSADEVWRSRFGDCKGKTALLIALLRGLGIEAEPAAVSTVNGDGMDERLPMVGLFDHVIVRAVIDGREYWIDGARTGDRTLDTPRSPSLRWALPLRDGGATLTRVEFSPVSRPEMTYSVVYDASAGIDAPVPVQATMMFSGAPAQLLHSGLASQTATERTQSLRRLWEPMYGGFEIQTTDSVMDETTGELSLTMSAVGRLGWYSAAAGAPRRIELEETSVTVDLPTARSPGPHADLPQSISGAGYATTRVEVRLPLDGEGFSTLGADIAEQIGGYYIRRTTTLADGAVVVWGEARLQAEELTTEEAAAARIRVAQLATGPVAVLAPARYAATEGDMAGLSNDTSDIGVLLDRAQVLMSRRDWESALVALNRAIEMAPDDAEALAWRGRLHLHRDDFDSARADFERALALDPMEMTALEAQGLMGIQERRFEDAVIDFSVLLRLAPENPSASSGRARANRSLGRADRALTDYRNAARLHRGYNPYQRELVELLADMGRTDEARTEIQTWLEADPEDDGALLARASLEMDDGDHAAALLSIEAAMAASETPDNLLTTRAVARHLAGDAEGALADLRAARANALNPMDASGVCWTGATLGIDIEAVLEDCRRAVAGSPRTLGHSDGLGLALLRLGRPAEALEAMDGGLVNNEEAGALYGRSLALRALGRTAEAEAARARALTLNPRAGRAYRFFEAAPIASASN